MILEFKVENFLSIKDEQVLSFEATSDKHLEEYLTTEVKPGVKILKMAMIYGANASGKTNVLRALEFLRDFAVTPKERGDKTSFIPFKFDYESEKLPGKFEITFFLNNTKFIYSLVLDENIVYFEELKFYTGTQPALLFSRKYIKEDENYILKFGSKIKLKKSYIDAINVNTLNNMSVISVFQKINLRVNNEELDFDKLGKMTKIFVNIYEFFSNIFIIPYKEYFLDDLFLGMIKEYPEYYKKHILENLKQADFNIIDYEIVNKGRDVNDDNIYEIYFTHKLRNKDGTFIMSQYEESLGTLMYFALLAASLESVNGYEILCIDELESSLHPELVNHFINTFLYQSKNKRSQFIFTTHNINLLDEDFVRKDIVWFTEKDEDGSTKLYSLSDFNIRKELLFSKAYKSGNFGAIPELGSVY